MEVKENQLLTVRQFCAKHPWPTESALRAIILDSEMNGFKGVFARCGRRVLVKERLFFETIDRLQEEKSHASKR